MQNDRTSHLNLPLPSGQNTLDEDLPRLRQALTLLDASAGEQSGALEMEAAARSQADEQETQRATTAESALAQRITGVEGKSARLNGHAFSFAVFSVPDADAQQQELTDYAVAQLGIAGMADLPPLIAVHNLNGDHLFVFNSASEDPVLPARWVDNGYDTVSEADQETFGVVQLASSEEVLAGEDEKKPVTPLTLKEGHDENADAHAALVRRITVGDVSPVIGVCQVATGSTTGLWYNVDADGQPVTPNKRYFDYHPVFDSMRRVLVDGQVMVRVEPFWFKSFKPADGPFAGKMCRVISPGQQDGFRPYPAFLDSGGEMRPLFVAAFSATDEGSSKAGSRPGKMPLVSLDFPTMRQRCLNRNVGGVTGFRMWDIYHYSALANLFLIENTTPESQGLYGRGWADSTAAVTVDDDHQPNWRGFTGLWGNVWQMVDGFRLDTSRRIEMFKNDGSLAYVATGKVVPAYDGSNVAYVVTNQEGGGDGWNMEDGYFPLTSNTSRASGTFPEYFYGGYGSAGNVLYVGGNMGGASGAGLFCWSLNDPAGHVSASYGCRLARL